ncbi:SAM-dependent DNA methyltransferase [Pseudomonas brassicacearum]|uniref:N-6 DNA methylase n=1 Tax=Pseudomonas brassicacearum TaxID=930166 RepID=UPI003467E533
MLDQAHLDTLSSGAMRLLDVFRSVADSALVAGYAVALLLNKYLSDASTAIASATFDHEFERDVWGAKFAKVPARAHFLSLCSSLHEPGIGNRINNALRDIERENPELGGVWECVDFESSVLGNRDQRDRILAQAIDSLNSEAFSFSPFNEDDQEAAAALCRILLTGGGKHRGDFWSPLSLCELMARLMRPRSRELICNPFCKTGLDLIMCNKIARRESDGAVGALYGQEANGTAWALAKMTMMLHGETDVHLQWGDSLRFPYLEAPGQLQTFDVVLSTPGWAIKDWGHESAVFDPFNRYWRGVPPKASGDYAVISHMISTLRPEGRMAVVVPLGVLSRGAVEQQIRKQLIEENLIDAVIALPPKLFGHTGISTAILVVRKRKADDRILLIDASRNFEAGKTQNILRAEDVGRIDATYHNREVIEQYSRLLSKDEVAANQYNLSVARYFNAVEQAPETDLAALQAERVWLSEELSLLEKKLATLSREVGHG